MIARCWSARATPALAPAYVEHLRTHVLAAVRAVPGYAGALLLQRPRDELVEILVITWWTSLEAIRGFAGPDVEAAVVADAAVPLLAEYDQRVRHFELVLSDEPAPGTGAPPPDRP